MAQQALAVAKAALDLDPASPSVSHYLALQLYLARQFDQAIEQCHKTLDLDPNFAIAYQVLGQAYLAEGMNREAEPVLEKYSALSQGSADSQALLRILACSARGAKPGASDARGTQGGGRELRAGAARRENAGMSFRP